MMSGRRVGLGDFDGIFIGFSAAVDEEGALLVALDRRDGVEFFRQGDVAFMGDDVGHGVEILPGLVLDGFDDFRLGIADVQDADAADQFDSQLPSMSSNMAPSPRWMTVG